MNVDTSESQMFDLVKKLLATTKKEVEVKIPCVVTKVISRTKVNVKPLIKIGLYTMAVNTRTERKPTDFANLVVVLPDGNTRKLGGLPLYPTNSVQKSLSGLEEADYEKVVIRIESIRSAEPVEATEIALF